jgi:hypothetical protein
MIQALIVREHVLVQIAVEVGSPRIIFIGNDEARSVLALHLGARTGTLVKVVAQPFTTFRGSVCGTNRGFAQIDSATGVFRVRPRTRLSRRALRRA